MSEPTIINSELKTLDKNEAENALDKIENVENVETPALEDKINNALDDNKINNVKDAFDKIKNDKDKLKKNSRKRKRYDPVPTMTSKQLRDQLASKGYTGLTKLNKIELNMMLKKDAQTEKRKVTREKNKKKHEELSKKVEAMMAQGVTEFEDKHEKKIYEKLLKKNKNSSDKSNQMNQSDKSDKSDKSNKSDKSDSSNISDKNSFLPISEADYKLFQKYMSEKNAEDKRAKKKQKKN